MTRDEEQELALNHIRKELMNHGKALAVACTGYGKGKLIQNISKTVKGNLLVVAPRVNLVDDLANRIGECSIYCASLGKKEIGKVTVSTKQSIEKMKELNSDVVILDELHQYKNSFLKKIKAKYIIGFTATPFDDAGFLWDGGFWNKPCYEFEIREAIKRKYLCPYRIYGAKNAYKIDSSKSRKEYTAKQIDKMISTGKTERQVAEILEIADRESRKKVAILCANIEHAEEIASYIDDCVVVHSKQKNANENIDKFKNESRFCTSVLMLSEGFNEPKIDMVVFLRPTRSTRLMIQAAGRGLRNETDDCIFLDFGDVFINCGTPDEPIYQFSKSSEARLRAMRQCEKCYYIYSAKEAECPSCGHVNKVERDITKNLNSSVMSEKKVIEEIVHSHMFIETKLTKNRAKYAVFRTNKRNLYFFGKHFKIIMEACRSEGKSCKVRYVMNGKFPKVMTIERE